jgi:hypothetical protein
MSLPIKVFKDMAMPKKSETKEETAKEEVDAEKWEDIEEESDTKAPNRTNGGKLAS